MSDSGKCLVCGGPVDDDGPRVCEDHWRCPCCGADVEHGFFIDYEGMPGDESVECESCLSGWDYAGIERDICKKHGIEPPSAEEPADDSPADVVMIALPRDVAEALLAALKEAL